MRVRTRGITFATGKSDWTDEEFFASVQRAAVEQIDNDTTDICQGKDPRHMRVVEIGCGAGRVTRALYQSNGMDLIHIPSRDGRAL